MSVLEETTIQVNKLSFALRRAIRSGNEYAAKVNTESPYADRVLLRHVNGTWAAVLDRRFRAELRGGTAATAEQAVSLLAEECAVHIKFLQAEIDELRAIAKELQP